MFIASHVHKNNSFVGFVTSFSFVGLLLGSEHLEFAPNVVETNFEVSASANPSESCAILATNADRSFTFDLRRDSFKCDTSGHDSLKSRDVSPIVCALFATQSPGFGYFCRLSGLSFQIWRTFIGLISVVGILGVLTCIFVAHLCFRQRFFKMFCRGPMFPSCLGRMGLAQLFLFGGDQV